MNGEVKQTKNQRTIGTATASQTSFLEVNPTLLYFEDIYMVWMNGKAKQTKKTTYNWDSDRIADQLAGSEPDTSVL